MTGAFDVCGPLPTGVTVLEASAGTGKTFTIAALAARYVAEGVPLDQLLMVTFGRMATGELRERVRERLVSAEHGLERALAGAPPQDDEVLQLLATGTPDEVRTRRERLAGALADFDSATIATTHAFCQEVLGGLGVLGDIESETTFMEDVTDLREEVVDDLYLRKFARRGTPQFTRAEAMEIARVAIANPAAPIEPANAPETSIAALRVGLAGAARKELEARKRRTGVMTYDDLLTRLSDTLAGDGGEVAAARLRARYRVVLVDEFQDTDPVQWQIMRTAFGDGKVTLVLIGDPKQAIYAFRGADVYAYIEAAQTAGTQATLTVNWRSDQGLIDAYDALFGAAKLGHEGIVYREVRAANQGVRPLGAPDPAPLRVRVVPRDTPRVGTTARGFACLNPARQYVACDVASEIVELLRSGAEIEGEGPVRPRHIAVLVRTNKNASAVRDALEAVDVPAVINGAGSVFGTEPAREWLRLLEAIERPSYPPRARSAALTTILGWTTEQVAAADDDAWEGVHRRLHHWARVLRVKGVASLMEAITLEEGLPARLLGMVDGERQMTDLRHVGELLHAAAMAEQMGATALTAWLRQRVLEAAKDNHDEERSRRLESDAEAVQVLTMHRSKGLEFPVVFYPDLWEPSPSPRDDRNPVIFHDATGTRTIDVGLEGPQWKGHLKQHVDEQRGEDLRLAYVALTRAKHQAVVWWAGSFDSRNSALSRLLFARDDAGNVASSGAVVPSDVVAHGAVPGAGRRCCRPCERRAGGTRAGRVLAGRRDRDVGAVGVDVRSRDLDSGGGGRPSATSPRAPTRRGWQASRRSPSSTTSPRRMRRRLRMLAPMSCERCRPCSPRCRSGSRSGRWSTGSSSRWTSRQRISMGSWSGRSRPHRHGGGSSSVISAWWWRGSARRSRRRWVRWRAGWRCGMSRAPTGSTSSTSSCPWWAATRRADRR